MSMSWQWNPPTEAQTDYVRGLQRKLKITDAALDLYCQRVWARPFADLLRPEVSRLIDDMKEWTEAPAELRRAMGQLDLFGGAA